MRATMAMPGKALLVSALTLALVPVLGVGTAHACSCVGGATQKQQLKSANAVFAGTVDAVQLPPRREVMSSADPVTYTFAVRRVFKGAVTDPQRVRSVISGASCGLELGGDDGPFLVFAQKPQTDAEDQLAEDPEKGLLEGYLCAGTRSIGDREPPFGRGTAPEPLALAGAAGLAATAVTAGVILTRRRRRIEP